MSNNRNAPGNAKPPVTPAKGNQTEGATEPGAVGDPEANAEEQKAGQEAEAEKQENAAIDAAVEKLNPPASSSSTGANASDPLNNPDAVAAPTPMDNQVRGSSHPETNVGMGNPEPQDFTQRDDKAYLDPSPASSNPGTEELAAGQTIHNPPGMTSGYLVFHYLTGLDGLVTKTEFKGAYATYMEGRNFIDSQPDDGKTAELWFMVGSSYYLDRT